MTDLSRLAKLVVMGENLKAVAEADRLISAGVSVEIIIKEGLTTALQSLKNKCTVEDYQLLDVLLASRAMIEVIDQSIARGMEMSMDQVANILEMKNGKNDETKTLIIGTIIGDVHDLGKHLVSTISRISGIRVINLGKDVAPELFVKAAVKEKADIIGVSSLMTVCLSAINEIRPLLKKSGICPKIVAGGAAVQQTNEGYLDVDYIAFDAFDGLNYFQKQHLL